MRSYEPRSRRTMPCGDASMFMFIVRRIYQPLLSHSCRVFSRKNTCCLVCIVQLGSGLGTLTIHRFRGFGQAGSTRCRAAFVGRVSSIGSHPYPCNCPGDTCIITQARRFALRKTKHVSSFLVLYVCARLLPLTSARLLWVCK